MTQVIDPSGKQTITTDYDMNGRAYRQYDGNGSLVQSMPGDDPAQGASRYTYNTAGFLVKVESYGASWDPQAEMGYDGLGNRLSMTGYAAGGRVTTQYELDNSQVLAASANDLTTTYLYGLGPIGPLTAPKLSKLRDRSKIGWIGWLASIHPVFKSI
jgi:hypothetical protein